MRSTARCSPTTRWPTRSPGATTMTRSATGTRTPATKHPIWQANSRRTATTTEKRHETWHPSRLPAGGVPRRQHRRAVSDPLDDHELTHHRVGNIDRGADLPLGGGRSIQRLASVLDGVAANARYGRPGGKVLPTLRPWPVIAAKAQGRQPQSRMKPLLRMRKSARKPSCGMSAAVWWVGCRPPYTLAMV